MRGIGPCYRDKFGRSFAVRLGDMYRPDFRERDRTDRRGQAAAAGVLGLGRADSTPQQIFDEYSGYAERLQPFVADTTTYLLDAVEAGKRLLFEGAQGSLLDIDHGTFPFVTSSNSSGVGVSAGSGVPARWITKVIGVVKAYTTRVGGGPFPTEQTTRPASTSATGARVRHGHRPPAALRLVRRRGRPLHGAVERRRCAGGDAAGRAQPAAGSEDLRGLRVGRPAIASTFPATWTTCAA